MKLENGLWETLETENHLEDIQKQPFRVADRSRVRGSFPQISPWSGYRLSPCPSGR